MNATTTKQDFAAIGRVYPTWNAPLAGLPISFTYGGKEYRGMPEYTRVSHELTDANIMRATFPAVLEAGLEVQLTYGNGWRPSQVPVLPIRPFWKT